MLCIGNDVNKLIIIVILVTANYLLYKYRFDGFDPNLEVFVLSKNYFTHSIVHNKTKVHVGLLRI